MSLKKPLICSLDKQVICIAARDSALSRTQANEVISEIHKFKPEICFKPFFLSAYGDKDRTTSLRDLEKTDFFTREIDQEVLKGNCRIAVHSAKDLPDPIAKGLMMVALTQGVDSSDALVLREGEHLRKGAVIATSSARREDAVRSLCLCSDLKFVDIRGTIAERLNQLHDKNIDGVVIAEAALIRLHLTHLNRIILPGPTTPFQGQLAVMARAGDEEMRDLFSCIDSRI